MRRLRLKFSPVKRGLVLRQSSSESCSGELDQGRHGGGFDPQARRHLLRSDVLFEPRQDSLVRRWQPENGLIAVHSLTMTENALAVVSSRLLTRNRGQLRTNPFLV